MSAVLPLLYVNRTNPIHRVNPEVLARLVAAQQNDVAVEYPSAGALCERTFADLHLDVPVPHDMYDRPVDAVADRPLPDLAGYFREILAESGIPAPSAGQLAMNVAQRLHLLRAFSDPDRAVARVSEKVGAVAAAFPREAAHIDCGTNPGDVLDPYILAATQTLLYQGDFSPAMGATVAHKAIMMIEGLLGHLHEEVIGDMRGNVRAPEPRGGTNQEILDPFTNPFPGADVVQPPLTAGDTLKFHQVKSKTGSAKGGDGRRLGEQLRRLQQHYGGETYYDAIIGNTLRGHRSMAGAVAVAPEVIVLVGEAAVKVLTRSPIGPELLLRVYQAAFIEVAQRSGYSVEAVIATVVATFKARAEAAGEGFLESVLRTSVGGPVEQQDSRRYTVPGRRRRM